MAHWIALHAAELLQMLAPPRATMPSESTIRRLLRCIDLQALQRQVSAYNQQLAEESKIGLIMTEMCPCSRSISETFQPMKPAQPVIKTVSAFER